MIYLTEPLQNHHKKAAFSCGKTLLDSYLHTQAGQDIKRKLSACFILADNDNNVKAYYTLSSTAIDRHLLPEDIKRKMPPSYHNLPATLLGRLAVSVLHKGQGLGALLLADALKRSYNVSTTSIGSMAVIVDPIDEEAAGFYNKYGFIALDSGKMFLPMETIAKLV